MAGLLDFVSNDPESRLGISLLAGASPRYGRGLLGMLETNDRTKQGDLQRQLLQSQITENQAQAEMRQQQALMAQQRQEAAMREQQALPLLYGQSSPGQEGGASSPGGIGTFNVRAALEAGMDPDKIQKYAALQNIGRQKVARTVEGRDPQGRPVVYQVDDYGQRIGEGIEQWKAPMVINQGDRQTLLDPASRQSVGSFGINMSQSERDASARGWAGNAIARERLNMDRADAGPAGAKAPTGYRWSPDGSSLIPIPGGPAEKGNTATEGERKAGTLLGRLESSQTQYLNALKDDKNAAKPGLLANGLRSLGADAVANTLTGESRQRVEAAQLDMLDAALTLGTGAAYTKQQLEGYQKSYFPQIGDDPKTIKEKQERLDAVIGGARLAAGRAAPAPKAVASNVPMKGQVVQGYKFKGGDPANQANWEKQ